MLLVLNASFYMSHWRKEQILDVLLDGITSGNHKNKYFQQNVADLYIPVLNVALEQ